MKARQTTISLSLVAVAVAGLSAWVISAWAENQAKAALSVPDYDYSEPGFTLAKTSPISDRAHCALRAFYVERSDEMWPGDESLTRPMLPRERYIHREKSTVYVLNFLAGSPLRRITLRYTEDCKLLSAEIGDPVVPPAAVVDALWKTVDKVVEGELTSLPDLIDPEPSQRVARQIRSAFQETERVRAMGGYSYAENVLAGWALFVDYPGPGAAGASFVFNFSSDGELIGASLEVP